MDKDSPQGTVTLARVFAEQGYWEKSVEIYRNLLQQNPNRQDLVQALAEAEAAMRTSAPTPSRALVALFQEWIDLMLKYEQLRKLRRFKARM